MNHIVSDPNLACKMNSDADSILARNLLHSFDPDSRSIFNFSLGSESNFDCGPGSIFRFDFNSSLGSSFFEKKKSKEKKIQ